MKKVFFTMMVALFATAVLGQNPTPPIVVNGTQPIKATQIKAPFTELPLCFKTYISKNYPTSKINAAQKITTTTNEVTGVNKTTGAKIYKQVVTVTYEVEIIKTVVVTTVTVTTVPATYTKPNPIYLSSNEGCTVVKTISSFTMVPM